MEKKNLIKMNKSLIILFILVQPFIALLKATIGDIQIFGFSLFEITNIVLMGISFLLTIWLYEDKKKFIKYIPYLVVLILYLFIHYYNTTLFNSNAYNKQQANLIVETYYILRTFLVPLFLIFNIYYSGIKKKTCIRILQIFLFIVSFVMIITNVFKIAYVNYSEDLVRNIYSIFDWFNFKNVGTYSYYELTTKGLFLSGNQMSAILFMTLPITIYIAYKKGSIFNYLLLVMQTLAMFMLGTKTANLGAMLVYVMFILLWVFFYLLKYNLHSIKKILIIFLFSYMLFSFSPIGYMIKKVTIPSSGSMLTNIKNNFADQEEYENVLKITKKIEKSDCSSLSEEENIIIKDFMSDYSTLFGIDEYIVRNYNDASHSGFWCQYLKDNSSNDYRILKRSLLKNIANDNNNKLDAYFGMGYTLNFIYTEADYSYQYYIYGICGIILLIGPYFVLIGYTVFKILKNMKNYFNLSTVIYIVGPVLGLLIAYYSGHVLERSFPLIILSFTLSLNLLNIKDNMENQKEKVLFISSTGGHLSELLQLKPMFDKYDYQIITEKTESTIGLRKIYQSRIHYLVFGTKEYLFSYIFKFGINFLKSFYYYIVFEPDYIISTGTHTAVPMCYIGKFFGSKIVFIETFANRNTKTLSGRMVYPIADKFIVQWEEMTKLYKDSVYGGWIY